jgi:Rps23 Pro-64 3,4-dihydroxylase Tpa1-like proline 4-hydroxylase
MQMKRDGHVMVCQANGSILPKNLLQTADESAERFKTATPFPHIVLDNLFDERLLSRIVEEFPGPSDIEWTKFRNKREIKLASNRDDHFGPTTRNLLYHFNSAPFLSFLSVLTGINNLIPDPFYEGGGLHQIERGGKLSIHADFNKHPRYQIDRRLNALLYLNKDWKDEYGGQLELWNGSMTRCGASILPIFNRLVVFETTDRSYHGHPDPLRCPEGMTRKSLALYYYTNGGPAQDRRSEHSTLFRERLGEDLSDEKPPLTIERLPSRFKTLAKELLPPIVTRMVVQAKRRIMSQ